MNEQNFGQIEMPPRDDSFVRLYQNMKSELENVLVKMKEIFEERKHDEEVALLAENDDLLCQREDNGTEVFYNI